MNLGKLVELFVIKDVGNTVWAFTSECQEEYHLYADFLTSWQLLCAASSAAESNLKQSMELLPSVFNKTMLVKSCRKRIQVSSQASSSRILNLFLKF